MSGTVAFNMSWPADLPDSEDRQGRQKPSFENEKMLRAMASTHK